MSPYMHDANRVGECRQTISEFRKTKGENRQTKGESRQTKSENRKTKGESRQNDTVGEFRQPTAKVANPPSMGEGRQMLT